MIELRYAFVDLCDVTINDHVEISPEIGEVIRTDLLDFSIVQHYPSSVQQPVDSLGMSPIDGFLHQSSKFQKTNGQRTSLIEVVKNARIHMMAVQLPNEEFLTFEDDLLCLFSIDE